MADLTMTDHPWQVYLHHRARVLRWLAEQGNDPELTARQMTMDPGQVRLILGYVHDYPEDFSDPVAPVPVPMARRIARERATALAGTDNTGEKA